MNKRDKIQGIAKKFGADAVIILDDSTRYWATGFRSSAGVAVVCSEEVALFIDGRYTEKAYAEKPNAVIYPCVNGVVASACEFVGSKGINSLLIDENCVTLGDFERLRKMLGNVKLIHQKSPFTELISQKDEKEIALIKEAVRITDECFSHIVGMIKSGIYESDISAEIDYFLRKRGCENAFETIVVSGIKSSMPHGTPEMIKICENSFITMDFGAKYKGYCSDLTRTVVLGKADDEMKHIYNTVLNANLKGIETAKYGVRCKDVDFASREYITQKGFGEYFSHSTGHSLGIDIHESPSVSRLSENVLSNGNVITIEPGIYIPGKYGVRIEDTILIKETETVVLSTSPKELIEI